ncbi:DNA ligase IV [Reticulomyxa filosa]|uniref:DNA ligase IV n=1 Tax=Reticulomyxa filosa TaxID=46433 RepID=X6MLA4_RETFI|nr:DNA ligase IV [Reticulomyxa filosa]|eukprot:ETO14798.1 DNA ligase IV [Reticulomyxa filosa]
MREKSQSKNDSDEEEEIKEDGVNKMDAIESGNAHLCFMAFDILMVDGECVMDLALERRKQLLDAAFIVKPNFFEKVQIMKQGALDTKNIMDCLDISLQNAHEGVVIKNLVSKYDPNKRGNDWVKLKPDYVDNMISHMDLLIVGGYFGEGKRRVGNISHFLLACAEKCEGSEHPSNFYTFCKVGSGYKLKELKELQERLSPYWKPWQKSTPLQAKHLMGWIPSPADVPDVWIEPMNSILVELLGNEIVVSDKTKFLAGYTVRFPRCKKFRYDKPWYECMTLDEMLLRMEDMRANVKNSKESAHNQHIGNDNDIDNDKENDNGNNDSKNQRQRKRMRKTVTVMAEFLPLNKETVEIKSNLFQQKEFCVLMAGDSKTEIEKLIAENGGHITANPLLRSTEWIVADTITPKVKSIICANVYDILRPNYIFDCIKHGCLINISPVHLLHSTQETKKNLQKDYDRFGDHYLQYATVDTLNSIFTKIDLLKCEEEENDDHIVDTLSDDEQMVLCSSRYRIFQRFVFYLDYYRPIPSYLTKNLQDQCINVRESYLHLIKRKIEIYGGKVSEYLDWNVTHIVYDSAHRILEMHKIIRQMMDDSRFIHTPHEISYRWICDSISQMRALDENNYHPKKMTLF